MSFYPASVLRKMKIRFILLFAILIQSGFLVGQDVRITDAFDEGIDCFQIETPNVTYFLDKAGGGLVSMVDADGNDWISHSSATGSAGEFRGIPNSGELHPGYIGGSSTTSNNLNEWYDVVSVESIRNGEVITWEFFSDHAKMTVDQIGGSDVAYWILYEGTPGGSIDDEDSLNLPDGSKFSINSAHPFGSDDIINHSGIASGSEWAYVTDATLDRSFYMAVTNDIVSDNYFLLENNMTVLGFGRSQGSVVQRRNDVGAEIIFGLADTKVHSEVRTIIDEKWNSSATISTITSDDFSAPSLNTSLWELEDPQGGATVTMTGTQASISIPGGVTHDPWISGNFATRLMQPTSDVDFEIEVKFETDLINNTDYGLMIKESDTRYLRFDFYRLGGTTNVFAAFLNGGSADIKENSPVGVTSPLWLRVARVGYTWTFSYSQDGTAWTEAVSFDQPLVVREVGPFVANSGTFPAFTALVDYFFNTASPIDPEDNEVPDETPPVISNVNVVPTAGGATITWTTDEPATSRIDYGLTAAYTDHLEDLTLKTDHSLMITGLTQGTEYHYQITSEDGSTNTSATSDATFNTLSDNTPPVISNIVASPSGSSAVITWTTDEAAYGRVDYGLSSTYTDFEEDVVLRTDQSIQISGLDPNTEYHYQVTSTDEVGNFSNSADLTFTTDDVTIITSDDFSAPALNTTLWEIEDPQGGATISMTGTRVSMSIPAGVTHDPWTGGNLATRLMQPTSDVDFEIEVKFDTELTVNNTDYGLMIKESDTRYIRFDFYRLSNQTRVFAAFLDGGTSNIEVNNTVTVASPLWMKVGRVGDIWTFSYSVDGSVWTEAVSFTQALTVTEVGPYVANSGGTPPAFTALIDYFFNTDFPIDPEDGIDVTPPVISNIVVEESPIGATISWTTDEPATSRINYGLTSSYTDNVEDLTPKTDHSLTVTGLAQATTYHYQIISADERDNETSTIDDTFTTTTDTEDPFLDVWYGPEQKVGHLGQLQDDFNLLGFVADESGVASLVYTLNGSSAMNLSIGDDPDGFGDGRRLGSNGDFNADILIDDLVDGPNLLVLTATDNAGNQTIQNVTINKLSGSSTIPYDIDWGVVSDPQDVGQYVDGYWSGSASGLRTVETGYDRIFLIGEKDWVDYEILVPVTIHSIDNVTGPNSGNPGLGIIMRFAGHIVGGHRNFPNAQPKWGYQPFGAIGWLRGFGPTMNKQFYRGDNDNTINHGSISITYENTYWIRMRAETLPDNGSLGVTEYSWKIWPDGQSEPVNWDWQEIQESEFALRAGGAVLLAHHVDATFGDVSIIDITPPVVTGPVTPSIEENQTMVSSYTNDEGGSWSLSGTDAALFSIDGGELTFLAAPDYENPADGNTDNIYEVVVEATDASNNVSTLTVTVTVTDVDEIPPVITGPETPSVEENQTTVGTYTNDEDGSWSLSGTDAALFSIDGGELAFLAAPDYENPADGNTDNFYEVVVEATDAADNVGTLAVTVTVTDLDEIPPVITGPETPSVEENQTAVVTYTNDEDGSWSLSGTDAALFSIDGGELTFLSAPDYENPADANTDNIYEVVVEATDAADNVGTLAVTVTVTDLDEVPPVITGPETPSVEENQTAVVTYTNDEDGSWSLSGTDAALFSIDGGELTFLSAPDYENPADANTDNIYEVVVEATDAADNVGTLAVTVTVTDLDEIPPVITGPETPSVEENQTAVGTYTNDEDGSWSLSGTDAALFSIDGGELAFLAAPDYENPADANTDNLYEVVVEATDASDNVGTLTVTITVTDVDEIPPVITGPENPSVEENQTAVASYTNDEGGSWSLSGVDAGLFGSITTGDLSFLSAPDYENPLDANGDNIYEVVVEATDASDNVGILTVMITVTDLDEIPPVITGPENLSVEENQTAVASYTNDEGGSWSLSGADAGLFGSITTGDLSFLTAPDYENPLDANGDNIYEVVVEATDTSDNVGTLTVTITVTDLDEIPPVIDGPENPSVEENQTAVGTYTNNEGGSWSLSGIDAPLFSIDGGELVFLAAPDYEDPADADTDNEYQVVVEATDAAGNVGTQPVMITVTDLDEIAPIVSGLISPSIEENQTAVGTYTNNEGGSWSLSGIDAPLFSIDGGELAFLSAPDFENPADGNTDNIYEVVVEAMDAAGNVGTLPVTITVTDLDEIAPIVSGLISPSIEENQMVVGSYTNNESGSWSLSGTDAAQFSINGGELAFLAAPDYEDPADADTDNEYQVVVEATDAAGNVGTLPVTITVTDLDEIAPIVTGLMSPSIEENQMVVGSYSSNESVDLSLSGVDAALFSIEGGELAFITAPNYENPTDANVDNNYEVVIEAIDAADNTGIFAVTITVTNVDEPGPVISGPESPSIPENQTAIGTYVSDEEVSLSLSGIDADLFSITNGMVEFSLSPDYENPQDDDGNNVYHFTIEALDNQFNIGFLEVSVTVTDADEERPLIFGVTNITLLENRTLVSNYTSNESVTWSLGGTDANLLAINSEGELRFNTPPDFEQPSDSDLNNVYQVVIVATDDASNIRTLSLNITITDADEISPVISGPVLLNTEENSLWTGGSYTTDDTEENGAWSIVGEDGHLFSLVDGDLYFIAAPDYENPSDANGDNIYNVEIEYTDASANKGILDISIIIIDLDEEAPVIRNLQLEAQSRTMVRISWNTDELAQSSISYGLSSAYTELLENGDFTVNHSFSVSDLRPNTTYHFQLTCTDAAGNTFVSEDIVYATNTFVLSTEIPKTEIVSLAYPNPFHHSTKFSVSVPKTQHVRIAVTDLSGREISVLHDDTLISQKEHEFIFENREIPQGIYLLRIIGSEINITQKLFKVSN